MLKFEKKHFFQNSVFACVSEFRQKWSYKHIIYTQCTLGDVIWFKKFTALRAAVVKLNVFFHIDQISSQ